MPYLNVCTCISDPLEVLQYSNKTEDNLFETVVSMNVYPLPVCVISFQVLYYFLICN